MTAFDGHRRDIGRQFISSEIYLHMLIRHTKLQLGRFPMLAYLQCCEYLYLDEHGRGIESNHGGFLSVGEGRSTGQAGAKTCFQAHCNKKRCPASKPYAPADRVKNTTICPFKYDDEGTGAVVNAELLAMPAARLAVAAEPPMRVEIQVPPPPVGYEGPRDCRVGLVHTSRAARSRQQRGSSRSVRLRIVPAPLSAHGSARARRCLLRLEMSRASASATTALTCHGWMPLRIGPLAACAPSHRLERAASRACLPARCTCFASKA